MIKHELERVEILKPVTIALTFKGGQWARMTFTEGPKNRWHVAINSDWGSWGYWWGRSGMGDHIYNFIDVNSSYFFEKFSSQEGKVCDDDKTKKLLRAAVRKHFNNDYFNNKEEWLAAMREIREMEFDNFDQFVTMFNDLECFPEDMANEFWNFYCDQTHPRTKYFFKHIFKRFGKHIKQLGKEYDEANTEDTVHEEIQKSNARRSGSSAMARKQL